MGSWRIGNGWDFPCLPALPAPSQAGAEAPALRDLSIQAGGQGAETLGCHAPLGSQLPGEGAGAGTLRGEAPSD